LCQNRFCQLGSIGKLISQEARVCYPGLVKSRRG
jgi:hypothetical protein